MFSWWTSDCACKLQSSEVRRQFSSSCGSFIDYSWGSSSKTDGEPFLSSSSRWLAHGFDYIISWELICKSLSCCRHTSLFSILWALSGFPGLNQNICWPFWDPLFLPDTFLTLRSCAVGFHKASVFKKTESTRLLNILGDYCMQMSIHSLWLYEECVYIGRANTEQFNKIKLWCANTKMLIKSRIYIRIIYQLKTSLILTLTI